MRRDDEIISPKDQEYIRDVFARHAVGVEPEFCTFEMHHAKPPRRQQRGMRSSSGDSTFHLWNNYGIKIVYL